MGLPVTTGASLLVRVVPTRAPVVPRVTGRSCRASLWCCGAGCTATHHLWIRRGDHNTSHACWLIGNAIRNPPPVTAGLVCDLGARDTALTLRPPRLRGGHKGVYRRGMCRVPVLYSTCTCPLVFEPQSRPLTVCLFREPVHYLSQYDARGGAAGTPLKPCSLQIY